MKTLIEPFKLKTESGEVINSHETFLLGFNKNSEVIFFKSYRYPAQKAEAQSDAKLVSEQCAFWEFGAAHEFKIEHEDKKFEIVIPHP
jgi:hypothetical protein